MQPLHDAIQSASSEDCAQELLLVLPPMMRFVRKHMRSHRGGLSVAQFRTLILLESSPTKNLSAVAEFLGVSLPTASRIVTCMVGKGFIDRRECPEDRRHLELVLTTQGAAVMEKSRRATQQQLAQELNSLNDSQRCVILNAMYSLHAVFTPVGKNGGESGGSSPGARSVAAAAAELSDRS
jgi:DNA-binding MarR family transcriptional regulator